MLLLVSIFKAFSEVLALSLLGQGLLWLICGKARHTNRIYRMFAAVTQPIMRIARWIAPRFIPDRHVWPLAVVIVFVVWVVAGHQKIKVCLTEATDDPLCVEVAKAIKERTEAQK